MKTPNDLIDFGILTRLTQLGYCSMSKMARELHCHRTTVSAHAAMLEKRNWIDISPQGRAKLMSRS